MSAVTIPQGDQWKNSEYVTRWKADRRAQLEKRWKKKAPRGAAIVLDPLLLGIALVAEPKPIVGLAEVRELIGWESESLTSRAHRLEPPEAKKHRKPRRSPWHEVPILIAGNSQDGFVESPLVARATDAKKIKARRMCDLGLHKKANRDLSCGLTGGVTVCKNGHEFLTGFACGNRYCANCAPKAAARLFARQIEKLRFVSTGLLLCGEEDCGNCNDAIQQKTLPHWPPIRGNRPKVVCAKIDFTLRHDPASGLPVPERMRELNRMIKKFCRALEKRFHISRKQYGLAYCDELGGNNSNPHAHGVYVGPWLPQEKKQLSALWKEITGDSFILSIKYARDFTEALFHAVKYPAKFAVRSTPTRLADLEAVFHRVRRFHTLAAFYAPEAPKAEKPPARRCPICDDFLSIPHAIQSLFELRARGLEDIEAVTRRLARDRGMGDSSPP